MPGKFVLPSLAQVREKAQQMGANLTVTTVSPNVDANGKPEHAPETPVTEHPSQRYNAYRGQEMHGVKPGDPWDGGPDGFTDGTVPVHWDQADHDAAVVPVRIVDDSDEILKQWRTLQHQGAPTGTAPAQIIPRNRQRTKLIIKNISTTTQTLWISHEPANPTFNGFPLAPSDPPLELVTTGSVYAVSSDANPCPVAVAYEFVERVKF